MYSIQDYALNGLLYLNNTLRPRHKRLSQLMIYATTRCQSQCRHCNIWQKPTEDLSLDDIRRLMQSQCVTRRTTVGNQCWINFYRKYDIILLRNLERLMPKRLIERVFGPYQWTTDERLNYRQYFKNLP